MAFNPREQERLAHQRFSATDILVGSLNRAAPWESITDFVVHKSFCGFPIFPKQSTLLKLIFLETDHMTQYDLDTIEDWCQGFMRVREVYGVQPDIWERIAYLKARGYRRFPWIQMVLGRRGSKGTIGGVLGCEQLAYLHSLDNPQATFGIAADKDVYLNVGATNQTTAKRQLFADIRDMVLRCRYFYPEKQASWIAEVKPDILRVRTPSDLRRIARLKADKVSVDQVVASLIGVALGASSVSGRGATSFCLDPETPVLTADLQWVPIKSILPGDEVVGIDEYPTMSEGGTRNGQRKLHATQVLAKAKTVKKAYRLSFDNGRSVTCSGDHRWLLRRRSGPLDWRVTRGATEFHSLKVGDQIVQLAEPWEEDDTRDAGYLAGMFDGEGSLNRGGDGGPGSGGLCVFISQNPGLVLNKTLALLKEKGFSPQPSNPSAYTHDGGCEQWAIRGIADTLRLLGQIRPERLTSRAARAYEGISLRGKTASRFTPPPNVATIVKIEELPAKELIDIQTTTGTFVANGLISHNCNMYDEFAFHVQTGSIKSDDEIYKAWQPSLGQFDKEALTYIPSSPWTKAGAFYVLYQQARVLMDAYNDRAGVGDDARQNLLNVGQTVELNADPTRLIFQGPSWGLYEDWQDVRKILGVGYAFPKAPEPDLNSEVQQRERNLNPDSFLVEKMGQFREVLDAYLDPDDVDAMFIPPGWRDPLEQQERGVFSRAYRIHCDPGRSGANFALAIGHIEDAPPDKDGIVWPHVVFDVTHVWRPMDYPMDEETHKRKINYVGVHKDIEGYLDNFASTKKISFDQWQQAYFMDALKEKYGMSGGVRVSQVDFTEKENQARFEAFKTMLGLGWVHAPVDNFYTDNLSCLLELELKFLSTKPNGKVDRQETGPVTTKDLADCIMVVTVDLLKDALNRFRSGNHSKGAYGSTYVPGLQSGLEQERVTNAASLAGLGLNSSLRENGMRARDVLSTQREIKERIRQQGRGSRRPYGQDRLRSIHSREPKLPRR